MSIFAPRQRRVLAKLYAAARMLEEMPGEKVTQADMDVLLALLTQIRSRLVATGLGRPRNEVESAKNGREAEVGPTVDLPQPAALPTKARKPRQPRTAVRAIEPLEAPLKQGDKVQWTNALGAFIDEGEVALVLPAEMSPAQVLAATVLPAHLECLLDPTGTRHHDSYLVLVPDPLGGLPRLFWPLSVTKVK